MFRFDCCKYAVDVKVVRCSIGRTLQGLHTRESLLIARIRSAEVSGTFEFKRSRSG
jgi:hypothetical protein